MAVDIKQACLDAGLPLSDAVRVAAAVREFDDPILQCRAADKLIQAWHEDRRCPDPFCDGNRDHDGPHFQWVPE